MDAAEHFDTIVVGSGFGGSVTAHRLAAAGRSVCVLERGKAYPPGSFPRRPREMARNLWDPSEGLHGLFNLWSFRGIEAVVASGLGGGSLIYANVLIRKDEHWFSDPGANGDPWSWPIDRAALEPHYDAVEHMLGATPFPFGVEGYRTPKTQAMADAAQRLGLDWKLPNLAVSFAADGAPPRPGDPLPEPAHGNLHGRTRLTCRLCGECDIGCNDGAKNTLDHTYLSAAAHHGADVRTRCEVRRFSPRSGGGFTVGYVEHDPATEGQPTKTSKLPVKELTADRLVLAAGAFGTTFLLLRNASAFPRLGPALGTRFCGNGDLLGFLTDAKDPDGQPLPLNASAAPVITSTIRVEDAADDPAARGFYLQDAGYPVFADWLVEAAGAPGAARRALRFLKQRIRARLTRDPRSDLGAAVAELLGDGVRSGTAMPLLGMGRDVPDGTMSLKRGHLAIDWTIDSSKAFFERVRATMRDVADVLDGRYDDNPTYLLRRVVTVHPLGGAPMGRAIEEGVVDANGEAFAYPGLYVVDGAALPGPVGPNPALTIAAFADHVSDHLLEQGAATTPASSPARQGAPASLPGSDAPVPTGPAATGTSGDGHPPLAAASTDDVRPTSLWFTEEMKGYMSLGESDPVRGAAAGEEAGTRLDFRLTMRMEDIDAFLADPRREASAAGWVQADVLGGRLAVEHGVFNLFVEEDDPGHRTMLYRLFLHDGAGHPVTLRGYKDIRDDPGFDVWEDTTTLYATLLRGHVQPDDDDDAEVVGAGVLRILKPDFARQMTTFRTAGPSATARAAALARFGRMFLGELWSVYGGSLVPGGRG